MAEDFRCEDRRAELGLDRHLPEDTMTRNLCLLLLAGAVVSAVPLLAHHSFAATYFDDKTETVEGNLVQFVFRNPHSFVHLEAPDETGQPVRWAVEWGSGQQL